jgi:hypothetical protein
LLDASLPACLDLFEETQMPKTRRFSGIVVLSVCLIGSGWSDTVFAGTEPSAAETVSSTPATGVSLTQPFASGQTSHLAIGKETLRAMAIPLDASQPYASPWLAQRGWYRGGRRHNGAAQAEMILGAAAAITGAAILTYANRPECGTNAFAEGCSYGTKVVGTAVTAGGLVTFLTGAFSWR